MRFRPAMILLLSALLIVLGAFLPAIVGNRQDAAAEGKILFATINDVELQFSESDVTLREIISILCTAPESVEIPVDLTSLKRDRAESIALDMARRLQEACVAFRSIDTSGREIEAEFVVQFSQPVLSSSNLVDGLSNIFWSVEVSSKDVSQYLTLIIDDRTGTVCSLNYYDGNMNYVKTQMQSILYSFSYVYLEELGEEYFDYSSNDIQAEAQSPLDNSYLASSIRWWAKDYEYRTTFFVNTNGFYTYLATVAY